MVQVKVCWGSPGPGTGSALRCTATAALCCIAEDFDHDLVI
jgi:hypothetical protein